MDQLSRRSMPTVLRNLLPQSLTTVLLAAVLLLTVYLSVPPNIAAASASGAVDQHGSRPAAAKHHLVLIRQVTFEPRVLTVGVGDTVEWKNKDIVAHTATSARKGFDSSIIPPEGTWSFTAKKKGSYSYTCTLHPNMKGKLVVR